MEPAELFRANLSLVDRVIAGVCRRAGVRGADAEDFASAVRLRLMENDYAVLRAWEGRASLGSYLTVLVQRFLSKERSRIWGRWQASAEAERLGPAAVLLEQLLQRDGRALEEAMPLVRAMDPSLDRAAMRELAARLPARASRLRLVPLDDAIDVAGAEPADARLRDAEALRASARAARVVREVLAGFSLQDRMLIRFRFGAEMSIADAARLLGVAQRPLYRRMIVLLRQLRDALEQNGIDAALVEEVVSAAAAEGADFGLRNGKSEHAECTTPLEDRR